MSARMDSPIGHDRHSEAAARASALVWLVWGAFGALFAIKLNVVGEIYVGELFSVAALPLLLLTRTVRASSAWILPAGLVFSFAQLLSDIYNQTAIEPAIKGIMAPTLFCTTITVLLTLFERDTRRVFAVLAGVVLSQFVQIALWPSEHQQFQPWKWGYGHATLMAGLIWFSARPPKRNLLLLAAMLLFTTVSVLNDARSLAGLPLMGLAAYAAWHSSRFSAFKAWLLQGSAPFKLVLVLLPLAVLANVGLGLLFMSDWMQSVLDPAAAAKYRHQAQSEVGLLLAGRSEWLVSIQAFLDSPLLGHGSWAEDTRGYLSEYAFLRRKYGIADVIVLDPRSSLIPAHSFLFGAMVWAGIAGGLFWLFFSYRLVARYIDAARYLPVYFHVGLALFLWDLLFSPFGALSRWPTALFAAALLAASQAAPIRFSRQISSDPSK